MKIVENLSLNLLSSLTSSDLMAAQVNSNSNLVKHLVKQHASIKLITKNLGANANVSTADQGGATKQA